AWRCPSHEPIRSRCLLPNAVRRPPRGGRRRASGEFGAGTALSCEPETGRDRWLDLRPDRPAPAWRTSGRVAPEPVRRKAGTGDGDGGRLKPRGSSSSAARTDGHLTGAPVAKGTDRVEHPAQQPPPTIDELYWSRTGAGRGPAPPGHGAAPDPHRHRRL